MIASPETISDAAPVLSVPSARELAAEEISHKINEWNLVSQGGSVQKKHASGRYRYVPFAVGHHTTGRLWIFSTQYVQVTFHSTHPDCKPEEYRVFGAPGTALAFLKLLFI